MKKLSQKLIALLIILGGFFAGSAAFASILTVPQGGTGVNTITGILQGSGTSAFSPITVGTGLNFSGGTLSAINSGTVTSVDTSAPLTGGPITTSGTIGISQANTSTDGYLSSTDWNTFNTVTQPANQILFGNGASGVTSSNLLTFNPGVPIFNVFSGGTPILSADGSGGIYSLGAGQVGNGHIGNGTIIEAQDGNQTAGLFGLYGTFYDNPLVLANFNNGTVKIGPGTGGNGTSILLDDPDETLLLNATGGTSINGGDLFLGQYPAARNDTGTFSPANLLYTDNSGHLYSAPLSSVIPSTPNLSQVLTSGNTNGGTSIVGNNLLQTDSTSDVIVKNFGSHTIIGTDSNDNPYIYGLDGGTVHGAYTFDPTGNVDVGINGANEIKLNNQTNVSDYLGQIQSISTPTYTPFSIPGQNDIETAQTGAYDLGVPNTYTLTMSVVFQQLNLSGITGTFSPGDTVVGASSGVTGTVDHISFNVLVITFPNGSTGPLYTPGETVNDTTSGASATYTTLNNSGNEFDWTDTNGGSGTQVSTGTSPTLLSHGVSVFWDDSYGHTVGDQWSFTVSPSQLDYLSFDGTAGTMGIGDPKTTINGTGIKITPNSENINFNNHYNFPFAAANAAKQGLLDDGSGNLTWQATSLIGSTSGLSFTGGVGGTTETWLGDSAGDNGASKSSTVFIGNNAGNNLTNGTETVAIGEQAGTEFGGGSTDNDFSEFLGAASGAAATSASNAVFLGYYSGYSAANAANSIFIGNHAGENDTVDNTAGGTSILIGDNTSTGGFQNSVAIGAGAINTAANQLLIQSIASPFTDITAQSSGTFGIGDVISAHNQTKIIGSDTAKTIEVETLGQQYLSVNGNLQTANFETSGSNGVFLDGGAHTVTLTNPSGAGVELNTSANLDLGGTIVETQIGSTTYGGTLNYSAGFGGVARAYFNGSHSGTATGLLLPTGVNAPIGTKFTVDDLGGLATTDPITIDAGSSNTITGTSGTAQTFVLNSNGESVTIVKLTSTAWMVE